MGSQFDADILDALRYSWCDNVFLSIFQNISLEFSAELNASSVNSTTAYMSDGVGSLFGSEVEVDELNSKLEDSQQISQDTFLSYKGGRRQKDNLLMIEFVHLIKKALRNEKKALRGAFTRSNSCHLYLLSQDQNKYICRQYEKDLPV